MGMENPVNRLIKEIRLHSPLMGGRGSPSPGLHATILGRLPANTAPPRQESRALYRLNTACALHSSIEFCQPPGEDCKGCNQRIITPMRNH